MSWQHERKIDLINNASHWKSEIEKIDPLEAQNLLTEEDSDRRKALKANLVDSTIKESQYWAQRAKRL